jgi:hypothetical protein
MVVRPDAYFWRCTPTAQTFRQAESRAGMGPRK